MKGYHVITYKVAEAATDLLGDLRILGVPNVSLTRNTDGSASVWFKLPAEILRDDRAAHFGAVKSIAVGRGSHRVTFETKD